MMAGAAGLVAAAVGLGLAEVIAGVSRNFRSPVVAVGDRVVDFVPGPIKDVAIAVFGNDDKVALLVGIGLVLAIYAIVTGIVADRRHPRWGDAGITLFAVVGATAAIADRIGVKWSAGIPSVVGGVAAILMLRLLLKPLPSQWGESLSPTQSGHTPDVTHPSQRRRFIAGLAAATVGSAVLAGSGRRLQRRFEAEPARQALTLPESQNPLPDAPPTIQVPSAATFFTPNDDFYRVDTALVVPQVDVSTWTLAVTGMVGESLTISYGDLLERPLIEADITMTCVSNTIGGGLVGTARWLGVRLDELLEEAGVEPAADQIVGRSVDGYTCGFPTAALDGRDALVAVGMNGEALPLDHGFPARLVVPGIYGYASATKWLTEIELTTFEQFDHYWVPRGYARQAPIKMQSRIDSPRGLDKIAAEPTVIGGVAWAQPLGISAVEVSIDDGPWTEADLADELSGSTWRQWSLPWEPSPGRHTITVRAVDNNKAIQTEQRSEPLPNGASGHHTIVVLVAEQ